MFYDAHLKDDPADFLYSGLQQVDLDIREESDGLLLGNYFDLYDFLRGTGDYY